MSNALPTDLTLAEALKGYRDREMLTQQELAKRLHIPVRTLQTYEAGAIPQAKRRRKILAFLARDPERRRAT